MCVSSIFALSGCSDGNESASDRAACVYVRMADSGGCNRCRCSQVCAYTCGVTYRSLKEYAYLFCFSLDDIWDGTADFAPALSIPVGSVGFNQVDAGTRVVVVNGTWYMFGRYDTGPTAKCNQGEISINIRASTDKGYTWTLPQLLVKPDEVVTCMYADGGAFFDAETVTWHYIVQVEPNSHYPFPPFTLPLPPPSHPPYPRPLQLHPTPSF